MAEDVLVIGGGPAGIACAYALEKANISYKVVEKGDVIATTWDSLYPSLRLNTTRFYSHLPEKRFPLRYGLFPTGRQYHDYLEDFVNEHDFNIHLGVSVARAYPEGDGWRVESHNKEGDYHSEWYPAVISATGRFSAPTLPQIPGMDDFQGEIIHAKYYQDPQPFVGQRVMVVGNGPSGVDIATELGKTIARPDEPVLLSQRTGVVLRPRYPLGLPKHLWMIIADYLPQFLAEPLLGLVSRQKYNNLERVGIKTPKGDMESSAAGGTRGKALIEVVKAGKVKSVNGPVRFYEQEIELQDGSRVRPNVVIMATGYRPVLYQYLDIEDEVETNEYDWPRRVNEPDDVYWQGDRQVKGFPGLYLVGVYYQGKGAMYNFNVEAEQAVAEIREHLKQAKRPEPAPAGD